MSQHRRSQSPLDDHDLYEEIFSRPTTSSRQLPKQSQTPESPSWLTSTTNHNSLSATQPKPSRPSNSATHPKSPSHRRLNSGSAQGGRIRGTNLKPSRGYIAGVTSSRKRSQPSSSKNTHSRKDKYPAPRDEDEYTMQDDSITSSARRPPRRSTRQCSIRPGGYTIPEPDEIEDDSISYQSRQLNLRQTIEELDASDPQVMTAPMLPQQAPRQFFIGIDYGTTFTSVSYASYPAGDKAPRLFPSDVKSIRNWPQDGMGGAREQLPTESWYPRTPFSRIPDLDCDSSESDSESDSDQDMESEPDSRQVTPTLDGNGWAAINQKEPEAIQSSTTGAPREYLWGYQVPHEVYHCVRRRDILKHVERPKLMLVGSEHTTSDRLRLGPHLEHLIEHGFITRYEEGNRLGKRSVRHVIEDFLTKVLNHTKQQLIQLEHLTEDCLVSFALTVPSIWSSAASRVVQTAIEKAIRTTQFGTLGHGSVDNLFIVTEAEAGATYAMACLPRTMLANETFAFMDCGGGTVDIIAYKVTNSYPLRLKSEVGKSTGDNCGASYLNEAFQKHLEDRLAEEKYLLLENDDLTIADIVRQAIPEFEDFQNRDVDIYSHPHREILIRGLKGDNRMGRTGTEIKRFEDNCVFMDRDDYLAIFLPLLERVESLLRKQLETAINKKKEIKKVFLVGGFSAAPSLRSHLKKFLSTFVKERRLSYDISLVEMNEQQSVIAVASGAVLRAMNLEQGPKRKAFSNYGFLRREPYEPETESGHEEADPFLDEFDEELYVKVIDYFMIKGEVMDPVHRFKPFKATHAFSIDKEKLVCRELLYVNDSDAPNHYAVTHPLNQGAEIAGKIIVDMTKLMEDGTIEPVYSEDEYGRRKGKLHYEISYDLMVTVEGRNLRYEARYPCSKNGDSPVWETGQISIAAAFTPGTG